MAPIKFAKQLDLRNVREPELLLRTADAVAEVSRGDFVEITTNDGGSATALALFAVSTGNLLLESSQFGSEFRFVIRKR
jgi:TusA-related sulfurtransferase